MHSSVSQTVVTTSSPARHSVAMTLCFILIGASPWIITKLSPPRYADQSPQTLTAQISSISNVPTSDEIRAFYSQPHSFFQSGRMLYPRFFRQNTGLSSANPSPAFAVRDYPRLGSLLLNQKSTPVVFPTRKAPEIAPHAADVIVLGCQKDDYVEVRLLTLPAFDIAYLSAPLSEPCSPR